MSKSYRPSRLTCYTIKISDVSRIGRYITASDYTVITKRDWECSTENLVTVSPLNTISFEVK